MFAGSPERNPFFSEENRFLDMLIIITCCLDTMLSLGSGDGLATPIDEVGGRRLAAGCADEHCDLTAMIPGVAVQLSEDVLEAISEPTGVDTLVLELPAEHAVISPRAGSTSR